MAPNQGWTDQKKWPSKMFQRVTKEFSLGQQEQSEYYFDYSVNLRKRMTSSISQKRMETGTKVVLFAPRIAGDSHIQGGSVQGLRPAAARSSTGEGFGAGPGLLASLGVSHRVLCLHQLQLAGNAGGRRDPR